MRELLVTGVCVSVFLIYLLVERLFLNRKISRIPLRICVTGTRGKSSVVRLLAASLRSAQMSVLAKTTGSKPCVIFPDGREEEVRRRGNPTVLEGKRILRMASRAGVHAVVMELMSIRPEFLRKEAVQMMKPHILVITNARVDHVDEIGHTKEKTAQCFASAIPNKGSVFIPEEELYPVYQQQAKKAKATLIPVSQELPADNGEETLKIPDSDFAQNYRLALAVIDFLGKDRTKALVAAKTTLPDFGGLKAWKAKGDSLLSGWLFVSVFAANDPESTQEALSKLEAQDFFLGKRKIGLLNLRKDRGGRTILWLHHWRRNGADFFDRLVFFGEHAQALAARLKGRIKPEIVVTGGKDPHALLTCITSLEREDSVLIGMGNMGGMGRLLVDFWEGNGTRYDL